MPRKPLDGSRLVRYTLRHERGERSRDPAVHYVPRSGRGRGGRKPCRKTARTDARRIIEPSPEKSEVGRARPKRDPQLRRRHGGTQDHKRRHGKKKEGEGAANIPRRAGGKKEKPRPKRGAPRAGLSFVPPAIAIRERQTERARRERNGTAPQDAARSKGTLRCINGNAIVCICIQLHIWDDITILSHCAHKNFSCNVLCTCDKMVL